MDNSGKVFNLVLPDDAPLEARHRDELLGGLSVIEGRALALSPAEDGRSVVTRAQVPGAMASTPARQKRALRLPGS